MPRVLSPVPEAARAVPAVAGVAASSATSPWPTCTRRRRAAAALSPAHDLAPAARRDAPRRRPTRRRRRLEPARRAPGAVLRWGTDRPVEHPGVRPDAGRRGIGDEAAHRGVVSPGAPGGRRGRRARSSRRRPLPRDTVAGTRPTRPGTTAPGVLAEFESPARRSRSSFLARREILSLLARPGPSSGGPGGLQPEPAGGPAGPGQRIARRRR